ncbi:hypothetical protein [Blastochloris tepida]|uniref:PIN domain-containing protein n=1 Tax=Blastochloris tepida TaxID=2233851 RepID=A0A348FXT1_9HYPH|nr:hypothetical protein [Blastochloris tepida]BBF92114.1 hypothetical protein BLTE_07990 [Blastochloris tepida]
MIVVFDTAVLVFVVDEHAKAPLDPATKKPVTDCQARVNHLIATLQRERATIIIPTPTLAEILVGAGPAMAEWLSTLRRTKHVKIVPFDERAAIEHALREADRKAARAAGMPRAKAKFDDQIIAIAVTERASVIYSDDPHIQKRAPKGIKVVGIAELQLPPETQQGQLPFEGPDPAEPTPEPEATPQGKAAADADGTPPEAPVPDSKADHRRGLEPSENDMTGEPTPTPNCAREPDGSQLPDKGAEPTATEKKPPADR